MISEIENEEKINIPLEKYNLLVWSKHEKLFRNRIAHRNKVLSEIVVPFTIALHVKLRRSVFGTYLEDLNERQCQNEFLNMNKLAITKTIMKSFNAKQKDKLKYNSNIFDEIMKYLSNTLTEVDKINCGFFYEQATHLRLDDYNINMVDDGIRNFKNLQVLVICDNWITDIHGSVLPRKLKFLELYVNEIKSVENLIVELPRHIEYLGLGRNQLTNDSSLHLLGEMRVFSNFKTLDLSECDIYSLIDVLKALSPIQKLEGLSLQGNPCSVVTGYKDIVLNSFPNLIFLDGVQISKSDRKLQDEFMDGAYKAELVLNCVKLTGIPKPPKVDKKIKQTFHVEYVLPLFQESTKEELDEVHDINETAEKEHKGKGKLGNKNKSTTGSKRGSKKSSKADPNSPYQKDNEYNSRKINNSFQTIRKGWSNNMKFPSIVLKSPENNLEAYRNSFRSVVNVRVVYLEFLPPEKKKSKVAKKEKKEKVKKSKEKQKKNTALRSTDSEKFAKETKSDKNIVLKQPEELKETILKKITLANFYCQLFSINWKDDENFFWSEEPSIGHNAVELQTYLQRLEKEAAEEKSKLEAEKQKAIEEKLRKQQEKKGQGKNNKSNGGKNKGGKGKGDKMSKKSKETKKSKKSKNENFMTCQVSFGLTRIGQELKTAKSEVQVRKHKKSDKGIKGKSNI